MHLLLKAARVLELNEMSTIVCAVAGNRHIRNYNAETSRNS